MNGKLCPYVEFSLESEAEHATWHLLTHVAQVQMGPLGPVGLDLSTMLSVSSQLNLSCQAVTELLGVANRAFVSSLRSTDLPQ